jgi:hypothetical protein
MVNQRLNHKSFKGRNCIIYDIIHSDRIHLLLKYNFVSEFHFEF